MKAIRSIEEIRAIIKSADLIAITTHINPDGDAIGSLIAFYEIVKAMGKETFMVVDDVIPEKYNFMPSVKHILNCERAKRETPDLLVVLDASTKERIGDVATLWNIQMLNIDHHISNEEFADRLYLLPHYAATGEIIAAMLADLDVEITPSIADALYLAIATDCGFFRYSNTTEHTLNMASRCVKGGARVSLISETVDSISLSRFKVLQEAVAKTEFYDNGFIAVMTLREEQLKIIEMDTDGFIDMIRNIEGVEIAILLKEISSKEIKASLRSKRADVNTLAAVFGGGGHIKASGCTIKMSLEDAKRVLVKEAQKIRG